ncbi:MAG: pyrroline-5-carboxylate reductase [Clostridiaceae bacterium]|nr:pyrroline-5-carboxylate reductase [Clostridiaceae bacterium]
MKLAVIGTGNMGQALVDGMVRQGRVDPGALVVYDLDTDRARNTAKRNRASWAATPGEAVAGATHVMMVVKPQVFSEAMRQITDHLGETAVLIVVAAGVRISAIRALAGPDRGIARVMPNTPALIGEGVSAVCFDQVPESGQTLIVSMLESCGMVIPCDERSLDILGSVSSTGPAWAMLFIEAMADGAVLSGLARDIAIRAAAATLAGAGKLVLETGLHPGVLKDQVCSPGGTTIEGIRALEKGAYRSSVIEAVAAAMDKTEKLTSRDD